MRLYSVLFIALIVACAGCMKEFAPAELKRRAPPILSVELKSIGFEPLWDHNFDHEIASMYLMNGNIFVETKEHHLYKMGGKDGVVRWDYGLGSEITAGPFLYVYDRELPAGLPAYDELYLLCHDTLHSIDEKDGSRLWTYDLRYPASSPPFASRSHIYYGGWDDRMHAIDKNDRTQDWEHVTGGDIRAGGQQEDPSVFFASRDGNVYCADASRGKITWKFSCQGPVEETPFLYRKRLYVASRDYNLYAIKTSDGVKAWKFPCESEVRRPVAVDTSKSITDFRLTVYCATDNHYFFAIDNKDGTLKWKLKDGARLLLVGRQNAYVLTEDKQIAAVDNETGELRWKKSFANVNFFVTNPADTRDVRAGKADYCIYLGFKNGWVVAIREKEPF
jgi:outer membrane protein assembly factor BamB